MKKTVIVLLFVLCVTLPLCSCKGAETDTDELIISEFGKLYESSKVLNEGIFGAGFEVADKEEASKTYSVAHYCKVTDDCPYQSTAELILAIDACYSKAYADSIKQICFGGADYDSEKFTGFQPRYKDIDGKLAADVTFGGNKIVSDIDLSDITVKEKKSKMCTITAKYRYDKNKDGDITEIEIKLVKENGKWLLDSSTY